MTVRPFPSTFPPITGASGRGGIAIAGFPLKQAALAGFGMVRRQPRVFAAWVVIELAQRLIDSQLRWMTQSGTPVAAMVDSLVAVALSIPFGAVLWLAVYRAFLRPGEARFSYLRLGRVELRMAGVLLLAAVAEATLSTIVLVGLTLRDTPLPSPKLLLPVLDVVSLLATIAAVRFMLIPAILVDQNQLSFRQSWRMTRAVFWPLAGLLLGWRVLSMAIGWMVGRLFHAVSDLAAAKGGGWLVLPHYHRGTTPALPDWASIPQFALFIYGSAFEVLSMVVVAGIVVTAYRALVGAAGERPSSAVVHDGDRP